MAQENNTPENQDAAESAAEEQTVQAEQTGDESVNEAATEEATPEVDVASLQAELAAAQEEATSGKDQVLRAQAEMQNLRRRAERDVENAHKFALEKITQELLPVVDNLERALGAMDTADEKTKSLAEGVEMTLSSFVKALEKFKIEQVSPEGEPFDPQLHQAMSMVENDDVEPNTVVAVMQKGYTLHGRLVRPAMVMVSKASAKDAPKIDEQA